MQNQALDGEECLNLKWAYDDPNPKAQEAIKCVWGKGVGGLCGWIYYWLLSVDWWTWALAWALTFHNDTPHHPPSTGAQTWTPPSCS